MGKRPFLSTQRIGVNQTRYVINSQPALSQVLVKEENGVKTFYVYGLGLIGEEREGESRSYHFDFRGSTVALTDQTGKVVERFQYGPYGELVKGDTSQTPLLFNGKFGVMTDSNGLYYMRARFYSAEMKRFVNQDVLVGKVEEGQTLNRFAFVTGRPVSLVDPFGLDKYCGQCAPGADDCLLYGFNLCEPEPWNMATYEVEQTLKRYKQAMEKQYEKLQGLTEKIRNRISELREQERQTEANRLVQTELVPYLQHHRFLDKYYHCQAFCEISKQGERQASIAFLFGEVREGWTKFLIVASLGTYPDTFESCNVDRLTNVIGLGFGESYPGQSCRDLCLVVHDPNYKNISLEP